jgi:hypothetical protein
MDKAPEAKMSMLVESFSRVQGFKGSRVQGFNGSMVQWFNGSMVQWFNDTIA